MPASERLTYRLMTVDDLELVSAHWNRPEVRLSLWDNEPVDSGQVAATLARAGRSHVEFGGGLWVLSVDGRFVGTCGLLPVFPELDSLLSEALNPALTGLVGDAPMAEVIYSLEPPEWGRGYALEATKAVLAHGHGAGGLSVIFGGTDVPNERSARTLRTSGMVEVAQLESGVGSIVYFASVSPRA